MCILRQIVWETQKWHWNFGRPSGSLVIDRNNILHDLINNFKFAGPTEIVTQFLTFLDNFALGCIYLFSVFIILG